MRRVQAPRRDSNDIVVVCRLCWAANEVTTTLKGRMHMVATQTLESKEATQKVRSPKGKLDAPEGLAAGQLSARDLAIIDFERDWWRLGGAKEAAIRETFDLSSTRYYQILNALLDNPDALAYDPLLIRRLCRLRERRQRARSARRLGIELTD